MATVNRRKADWSDVRVFWAVAELGSFGAAARALKLGLTTVTRSVDRLETSLNTKLFVRGHQGVSLTHSGSMAYDRALTMERTAEQLEHELADCETIAEGPVTVAAPDGIGGLFLAPFMSEFLRANPKIDLLIDCGLWPDRPLAGEVDLTLTFSEPRHSDVVATPLAHFHYGLFASPEHLDLYGTPKTVAEAITHPFVHHMAQNHQREVWTPRHAAFQDLAQKRIQTNSSAVSFTAVRDGAGIGAMPTAILSIEPSLVMLELTPLPPVKLWLAHHREGARSARIRCVIDWLRELFDPRTKPWYREEFVHPRDFAAALNVGPGREAPRREGGSAKRQGGR
ncbi:MAG TPA: LysR family transcriptional regulator [Caulobacteraceae bacterium]|jgi:DNA-binding transcriptional LysR family regulator|nr:LysR family transcriptional regulator [Caulobacteraceae bacterium]